MCLGIPGRLIEVINEDFRLGTVEVTGTRAAASLGLLPDDVAVGDWVLVHVGFARARIDEEDARRALTWSREWTRPTPTNWCHSRPAGSAAPG